MSIRPVSRILALVAGVFAFAGATAPASAHTITIGYENAGPGSVSFWYGSYHAYSAFALTEGSLNLVGVNGNPFASTTVAFTLDASSQPAGLVDGVTNFFDSNYGAAAFNDVLSWQGVNFSGLQAGDYQFTYVPIASPTAHWAPWSSSVLTGTVTLTSEIVQAPEPATLAVLGLGLAGLGFARRRRAA